MLDNWHNVARKFAANHHVYLLDLRNHGQSPHSDAINYPLMADDLWEFMKEQNIPQAYILGHSMGGKVAMEFALKYPEKCLKLIVVDIAPVKYKPGHNDIFKALFALDIDDAQKTRKNLDEDMSPLIPEFGIRQFLLKSLERKEEGGYEWKFNLKAIHSQYDEILAGIEGKRSYDGPTLFIRGANSPYVQDRALPEIQELFPNYQLETIEGAGHWVHAEKPVELIELVRMHLT